MAPNAAGIYYLSAFNPPLDMRAGRMAARMEELLTTGNGRVSAAEMETLLADTQLPDARIFLPHLLQAHENGQRSTVLGLRALANDPAVAEAVVLRSTRRLSDKT